MGSEFVYGYTQLPEDLSTNGASLTDWDDLPEINRAINGAYTFYGNYRRKGQFRSYLKKGNFVKAVVEDGSWQFFEITKVKKNLSSVSVTGRHIGYIANRNFIDMSFTAAGNGQQIMSNLQNNLAFKQKFMYTSNIGTTHQFTAKQVKPIDALIGSNNGNQNLVGVTGGELDMDNFNLKLVKRIGADNGFRIDLGVNLEAIDSEVDEESVVNSLYLVGGVPDNDYDEDKEPITFKYLEISGVNDSNRRIAKRENSECKTISDLKTWGNTLFSNDRIQDPKATHEISMVALEHTIEYGDLYEGLATLHFGDTAHVKVIDRDEEIEERMIEYTWFPTLKKFKDIVLGNDLSLYTSRVETQAQEIKKKIDNRTETLVTNVLNATAWITGNSGGHVVFRPEKAPEEILIMDTAKVATAKRVWRWNLNGLGYSSNGVNGPFDVAMTSKGEIVANFIKVGIINAEVLESSINELGDILKIVKGTLQIWNDKKKILELTKKGMQFWSGEKEIGTIGTTDSAGNPFPDASTPTPIPDNALVIRTEGDGKYILISPNKGKGFVMLANGTTIHFGDMNIQGKAQFYKDVDIKGKLTIKGQEVFPGQGGGSSGGSGGGSWNGMYPPEVTSQADKFAWELWVMLLSKGYSKAAAAGILGNVQGEAGVSMNPDIAQIGGPAYGIVQWDGSAYPLVPPATYDGRTYVQNLMRAAGITEDYRTMSAQGNLLDWTMYNGQWLGIVQPATQSGFKAMTDPGAAAYTFERNYERPANAHPERQGWAVNWYNKFKDLQIQSGGNILSTAKSLIDYFHYSQPMRWNFGSVENPDRNGYADCSSFVWLVLTKAGYRTAPRGTLWYTGSMRDDARGTRQYLTEVSPNEAKAGDIIIVNLGAGAGNDGHTAVLAEDWHGYTTAIVEMGGMQSGGAGIGRVDQSFGYLLNGGDVCLARAKK
ncbi:phage tail tip lysozyme [Enterococcus raffinosus]|uniref:Phage tail tip lysozyme n=3 Tax=Enterococcus raffinosus TaxID=71452 RepID=A0AAW8TBX5_9ENTE|nr:phage tail tip lysozyme [Enterococcus raffinosus]MDT2531910.1 phage tail tip lysozyme [Enterococcus raffinosus]MDT2546670.1 phage tail tip lysozyme [Enterococcus raffinosus]MDT2580021.1 phage tail tip lysozyme [Enterococcus raffinosus]